MTAAREDTAPASERAETYLRLRAEAELRAALGFPHVKPRREHAARRRNASRLRYFTRTMLQRRAAISRLVSAAPASSSVLTRLGRPAANALNRLSTRWSFRLHRIRWRWVRTMHRRGRDYEPPPAEACVGRLETIASALTAAGALDDVSAMSVVSELRVALAARSLLDEDQMLDYPDSPSPRPTAGRSAIAPVSCFPIGRAADFEIEGKAARMYLSALILGPVDATLEISATSPPEIYEHGPGFHRPMGPLDGVTVADDRGRIYGADFSGGGGRDRWDGRFHLRPVPPASSRWLDVLLPGESLIRIPLDAPIAQPTATYTPLSPDGRADRFLDAVTCGLLLSGIVHDDDDEHPGAVLTATVLLEAGIVGPDSASIGRFTAAAALTGARLPPALAVIPPRDLPAEWLSLVARRDKEDGHAGVIPFAAVLPELDGARCILTGLRSEPERATLHMHAQGWPERNYGWRTPEVFRWTARDDVGGCYLTSEGGGSWGGGEADLELWLAPPINPQAYALEVILTGPTGQVSVTVPLEWREGL
jgi:hypothetical protein